MTTDTTNVNTATLIRVANLAPVEFAAFFESLSNEECQEIERSLDAAMQHYARAWSYIRNRRYGGDHKQAVKRSNKFITIIRRALGYIYPSFPLQF